MNYIHDNTYYTGVCVVLGLKYIVGGEKKKSQTIRIKAPGIILAYTVNRL